MKGSTCEFLLRKENEIEYIVRIVDNKKVKIYARISKEYMERLTLTLEYFQKKQAS